MANWDTPPEPIHAQSLAVRWLEWACANGEVGETHPRYVEVTEGRDFGAKYSSCGDLAHWMLYRLGVRLPWLNREEHKGWRVGVNVSRLVFNRLAHDVTDKLTVEPGDIIVIWNTANGTDAHVVCCIDWKEPGVLMTAEYGQPGGALRERQVELIGGRMYMGKRRIQKRLPLLTVLHAAQEAGLLVDPEEPPA